MSLIEEWFISNFLSFNAGKCKYMIVSRKQSPIIPSNPLKLFGNPMQRVNCYRYLGLLLTTNLSWSAHISTICTKAKNILGLIYRRFYGSVNQTTLKQLYLWLVRPHLEYACQIWDPHLVRDKKMLENVQKFGCKLAAHQWDASYQELLELFELQPLEPWAAKTPSQAGIAVQDIAPTLLLPKCSSNPEQYAQFKNFSLTPGRSAFCSHQCIQVLLFSPYYVGMELSVQWECYIVIIFLIYEAAKN